MVYRLPTDGDGVKYHGVVDPDGDNPGQVLYGVDEHGNYRPVKVDNNGNVLTQVTGSNVAEVIHYVESDSEHIYAIGETMYTAGGAMVLDVSNFTDINILIENEKEEEITVSSITNYMEKEGVIRDSNELYRVSLPDELRDIPVGGSLLLNKHILPQMDSAFLSISIRVFNASNTGLLKATFWGRRQR